MTAELKRYSPDLYIDPSYDGGSDPSATMQEDAEGEYVRYEDAQRELHFANNAVYVANLTIKNLREQVERLQKDNAALVEELKKNSPMQMSIPYCATHKVWPCAECGTSHFPGCDCGICIPKKMEPVFR
jgi:rubrerythrin